MFYFVKTPGWLKILFKKALWQVPGSEKSIYLTFDDGPHPQITSFALDELKKYNARATFFCVGKNVVKYNDLYKRILEEGHAVGNHTFDHLNGWKTKDALYLSNIAYAKKYIDSNLFRPPYGRMTKFQNSVITSPKYALNTVMWSVLSGDFDESISPEQCCNNVIKNTKSGSISVFHDSEKAYNRMSYSLPRVLKYFSEKGYDFKKILLK